MCMYICVCMCVYVYVYMCVCVYVCVYTYISISLTLPKAIREYSKIPEVYIVWIFIDHVYVALPIIGNVSKIFDFVESV